MPRTCFLIGVDTCSASISQNPFAYQPKKLRSPQARQAKVIRDRRARLHKAVYGSTTERRPTANTRKATISSSPCSPAWESIMRAC